MTPLLPLLKAHQGNLGWSAVCLVMVFGAYLAQGERNESVLLELGELRSTVKYQEQALEELTERCFRD